MNKNTKTLFTACLTATGLLVSSCAPTFPGGLSEEEYNSLPALERAKLNIAQERADSARQANFEQSMDRYERQEEFKKKNSNSEKPSIHLSEKETRALNTLTE